jgi:C-terminal processing protease CtpA/Prc
LNGRKLRGLVYWPALVDPWRGSWTGPTYVLTNETTYSSAEMFAAVLQNNNAARIIGTKTGGDGCGFMAEGKPLTLPHSGLRFRIPNCVRLRSDGTDEVAGITPKISILPTDGESPRGRAARLLAAIVRELKDTR